MTRWGPGFAALALLAVAGCGARRAAETAPAPREAERFPGLVATEQLAEWTADGPVSLIDVRTDVFTYLRDHLPGAAFLHTETLRASRGGIPTLLLDGEDYARIFSRLGLSFDQRVVIYSAGESHNFDATFLAWILAGMGHPQVHVLDGGYSKWQLEHRPLERRYPRTPETEFPAGPFRPEAASLDEVRAAVERGTSVLVDARPPDQYAGEAGAQLRRGHIPGAISHYWRDDLERKDFGFVWKSLERLRRDYAAEGITPDKDIITYCNSGTEASHVHFTLRYLLGYPRVRVYVGSWTEWAEREELPLETGRRDPEAADR